MGRSRTAVATSTKEDVAEQRLLQIQNLERALRSRNQVLIQQGVEIERLGGPKQDWAEKSRLFEKELGMSETDVGQLQVKNLLLANEAKMNTEQLLGKLQAQRDDYEAQLTNHRRLADTVAQGHAVRESKLQVEIGFLESKITTLNGLLADARQTIVNQRALINKFESQGLDLYVKENAKLRRRLTLLRNELNTLRGDRQMPPIEVEELGPIQVSLKQ